MTYQCMATTKGADAGQEQRCLSKITPLCGGHRLVVSALPFITRKCFQYPDEATQGR